MTPRIPITRPYFDRSEEEAIARVIRSGWVTQGEMVEAFERRVADYVGAPYGVATSSCTTALHLALRLSGVGEGDEVIVPSLSYIATANPILYQKATPVFADVDLETYNLDPLKAEERITKRTKAIVVVHQLGLSADLDAFLDLARRYGLLLIQDAACALGAEYKGRKIGGIGDLACVSFHPRKIITTGEGGMLLTCDKATSDKARMLRSHGASVSDLVRHRAQRVLFEKYEEVGYNYRMTDIQAAMGLAQMQKLQEILDKRRMLAGRYNELLKALPWIVPPREPVYATHTYQSYCIRVADNCPVARDEIMARMLEFGIATRAGCMAIHREASYRALAEGSKLPVTEKVADTTLLIPLFPSMSTGMQDEVVGRLGEILGTC